MKKIPTFEKRGCGFQVTFFGATVASPGMASLPAPIEITDTALGKPVVTVLTVVEARQLAFDLLDAALYAEDAAKAAQDFERRAYTAMGLIHPGFSVTV